MKLADVWVKKIRIPIWVYHNVGPVKPGSFPGLTMPPEIFARQILWLKKHKYTPISVRKLIAWCRGGCTLPMRPILLTFDDAYLDISTHALPILEKHGYSALVFVVTDYVGKTNFWDEESGYAALPLMGEREVVNWSHRGIEFGSHSCSHPFLTKTNGSQLVREIVASGDELEAIINRPIETFAYPYGFYNNEISNLVRKRYSLGFSLREGLNTRSVNPAILKRTTMLPWDREFDLYCRAHFGLSPIKKLRSTVRLRTRLKKLCGMTYVM